ncbi:putative reverse transcriptase domain-containing protein [Tanacetum coccineum]
MLGIYQSETIATFTIVGDALQSVRSAKELVIWKRIVELYFQVHVMISAKLRRLLWVVAESNVVTGTFLLNDHYACILFDSGAEKSFVSSAFTPFIDIVLTALNTSYEVDFDVIVGMDWLSYHRAVIDCYEKIVRIPLPNGEFLEVQGERPEKDPGSLACIKADEKKFDDISSCPILPCGASRVVKSQYRLAPSEMLELSNQLKELQEKGFIRPSALLFLQDRSSLGISSVESPRRRYTKDRV